MWPASPKQKQLAEFFFQVTTLYILCRLKLTLGKGRLFSFQEVAPRSLGGKFPVKPTSVAHTAPYDQWDIKSMQESQPDHNDLNFVTLTGTIHIFLINSTVEK